MSKQSYEDILAIVQTYLEPIGPKLTAVGESNDISEVMRVAKESENSLKDGLRKLHVLKLGRQERKHIGLLKECFREFIRATQKLQATQYRKANEHTENGAKLSSEYTKRIMSEVGRP